MSNSSNDVRPMIEYCLKFDAFYVVGFVTCFNLLTFNIGTLLKAHKALSFAG